MNPLATANPLENPLVLVAAAVVWVIANVLMKRRQRSEAENQPGGDDRLPPPEADGRSAPTPDFREVLGQLLGGEPSPRLPRTLRDGESSPSLFEEEQAGAWTGEPREAFEAAYPPAHKTAKLAQQHPVLAQANAIRLATGERQEEDARRLAPLVEEAEPPATVVSTAPGRALRASPRAAGYWRDPRAVRRAFVASLVFAPPKALENCR